MEVLLDHSFSDRTLTEKCIGTGLPMRLNRLSMQNFHDSCDNGMASLDTFGGHRTVLHHTKGSLSEIGCKSYLEIE